MRSPAFADWGSLIWVAAVRALSEFRARSTGRERRCACAAIWRRHATLSGCLAFQGSSGPKTVAHGGTTRPSLASAAVLCRDHSRLNGARHRNQGAESKRGPVLVARLLPGELCSSKRWFSGDVLAAHEIQGSGHFAARLGDLAPSRTDDGWSKRGGRAPAPSGHLSSPTSWFSDLLKVRKKLRRSTDWHTLR